MISKKWTKECLDEEDEEIPDFSPFLNMFSLPKTNFCPNTTHEHHKKK